MKTTWQWRLFHAVAIDWVKHLNAQYPEIQHYFEEAKAGSRTRRALNNIPQKLKELGKWS